MALAQARRTHCLNGHPFSPENTRMVPRRDGRAYRQCIACKREKNARLERERRARMTPDQLERSVRYQQRYVQGPGKERKRLWSKRARLKRLYGLTIEEHAALLAAGCRICGAMEQLHIDHAHSTGKVRGVLCANCNRGLGMFQDNADRLIAAAAYLVTEGG